MSGMTTKSAFVPLASPQFVKQSSPFCKHVDFGRRRMRHASRGRFEVRCNTSENNSFTAEVNEPTEEFKSNVPVPLTASTGQRGPSKISYGAVVEQAATAIEALAGTSTTPPSLKITVDFPPERSETRAGTLVSRFENNLSFIYTLAKRLGVPSDRCKWVGPPVEIRDNVNPQGGGEYLTDDECMIGLALDANEATVGKHVTILLNAGVDASTLKQIQKYDVHENGIVVLVNCALDRVSWFAKLGFAKYIDSFSEAYYLKQVPPAGWLLKCAPAPWTVFVQRGNTLTAVQETEARPSIVDVQSTVRKNAN